jgi:hypothetical protein
MYLYDRRASWHHASPAVPWSRLCGLDDPPARAGTLVLYVRPTGVVRGKLAWSFDAAGRAEYEKALQAHLAANAVVPAKGTTYEPMTSSADIATLASGAFEDLVLIVHGAANGPAIGVDIAGNGDWLKDDAVARVMGPLGFARITILGCDAVSNRFAPSLARRLPKGAIVVGHRGGGFVINRHFEPSKTARGRAILTRLSSNFKLKTFKTGS